MLPYGNTAAPEQPGQLPLTPLSQVTGSCCTIMLLPTMQLSPNSFSQRKALLLFTIPLTWPDLAPADYFLFTKMKSNLKGHHFDTISTSRTIWWVN